MKWMYVILLLFFIQSAGAVSLTDNNDTDGAYWEYSSSNVVQLYTLDSSDLFTRIELSTTAKIFPSTEVLQFADSKGNKYRIEVTFRKTSDWIGYTFYRDITIYFNGVQQNMYYGLSSHGQTKQIINTEDAIKTYTTYDDCYISCDSFSYKTELILTPNIYTILSGNILGGDEYFQTGTNSYYFNSLTISKNPSNSDTHVVLQYKDAGTSALQFEVDSIYSTLNPVIKFLFIVAKALLKAGAIISLGAVTETDYLNYQLSVIEPLSWLSQLINAMLFIIRFLFVNGLLFSFVMATLIIFIYSYATSKDILQTFEKFSQNFIGFVTVVVIKPLTWFYDNMVLRVLGR